MDKSLERRMLIMESMLTDLYDRLIPEEEKRVCPVCNTPVRLYLPELKMDGSGLFRRDVKCPVCASFERHRAYALMLKEKDIFHRKEKIKILHFAPESCFYQQFSKVENVDYYPVDLNPAPRNRAVVDITDIPYKDEMFDFIMCTHVLEHVEDDKKAMKELYRVLKKGGNALINVPVNDVYEHSFQNPQYNTPELRLKYYGHPEHVRWYGRDYADLLRDAGFVVEESTPFVNAPEEFLKKNGIFANEKIHWCKKL